MDKIKIITVSLAALLLLVSMAACSVSGNYPTTKNTPFDNINSLEEIIEPEITQAEFDISDFSVFGENDEVYNTFATFYEEKLNELNERI